MNKDLQAVIKKLNLRIRAEEPTVMEDLVKLTEQYPDEPEAWDTLAAGYGSARKYGEAIKALTRAVELAPQKPDRYFQRGWYLLTEGEYEQSIADFTSGLVICDETQNATNRELLHFLRSEAYYQLGRTAEAVADLEHVDDDCTFWTIQLRSKADLLALCGVVVPPADQDAEAAPKIPVSLEPDAHLLMEDRSILPETPGEDETAFIRELGPEGLAKADATILKWVRQRWAKVARVLFDAIQADDLDPTNTHARVYLRRLIALADSGAIEAVGNLHRPRFSEVRLPEPD